MATPVADEYAAIRQELEKLEQRTRALEEIEIKTQPGMLPLPTPGCDNNIPDPTSDRQARSSQQMVVALDWPIWHRLRGRETELTTDDILAMPPEMFERLLANPSPGNQRAIKKGLKPPAIIMDDLQAHADYIAKLALMSPAQLEELSHKPPAALVASAIARAKTLGLPHPNFPDLRWDAEKLVWTDSGPSTAGEQDILRKLAEMDREAAGLEFAARNFRNKIAVLCGLIRERQLRG